MANGSLDRLFQSLWQDFSQINPQAAEIHHLLESLGEQIVNDHIAFRTFDDPRVNIEVLAKPFLENGYEAKGEYFFEKKHLVARHYEHPETQRPKIFISELILRNFSFELRSAVSELLDQIPRETFQQAELCHLGRPWNLSHDQYQSLIQESEYAGWMSAFGFRANHFTVLVNSLHSIRGIEQLNHLIKEKGFQLNADGGEIKGSAEVLLKQSSTLASRVKVNFTDGIHEIPGCYYEFAERYLQQDGTLFSGFVTTSADKIFQSTDQRPDSSSSR